MDLTTRNGLFSGRGSAGSLLRRGLLAAVLAAVANGLVFVIASALIGAVVVPPGEALTLGPVVAASVVGAVGAAAVLGVICRFSGRPVRVFRGIALAVLLLSLLPIPLEGVTWPSAGALALMHVVAAVVVVAVLTATPRKR